MVEIGALAGAVGSLVIGCEITSATFGEMALREEILEQPQALARLLDSAPGAFARIAAAVAARRPRFAVIAARGTSDNAALYAQYLFAVRNALAVSLAAPSTVTLYGARPDMRDALVVGISQSGRSPDIIAVLDEARRQGALTVALVNDAGSPLAAAADEVIDLQAGPERAIAATKSYTAELLAVALLSTALDSATQDEAADLGARARACCRGPRDRGSGAHHRRESRAADARRGIGPRLRLPDCARVVAQAPGAGALPGAALLHCRFRARSAGSGRARLRGAGGRALRCRVRWPVRGARAAAPRIRGAPPGYFRRRAGACVG